MNKFEIDPEEVKKYTYPRKKKDNTWMWILLALLYSYWLVVGLYFLTAY